MSLRKRTKIIPSLMKAGMVLLFILLAGTARPATGKELIPNPPPLTFSLHDSCTSSPCPATTEKVNAMANAIENLEKLYNGSWRPAIASLLANNSNSQKGLAITGFGILLCGCSVTNGVLQSFTYDAYVSNSNGTVSRVFLGTNDPIIQGLVGQNLSLFVDFGLGGYYFNGDPALQKYFFTPADTLVQRVGQLSAVLSNLTRSELHGQGFVSIHISALDENVVKFAITGDNHFNYSMYFGPGASPMMTSTVTTIWTVTSYETLTSSVGQGANQASSYIQGIVLISTGVVVAMVLLARRIK